jgi:hypothetical protein
MGAKHATIGTRVGREPRRRLSEASTATTNTPFYPSVLSPSAAHAPTGVTHFITVANLRCWSGIQRNPITPMSTPGKPVKRRNLAHMSPGQRRLAVRVGSEPRHGQAQLPFSAYGGAPTPAIECVPHGVCSTMRAGALRPSTVSVAARDCLSASSDNGSDSELKTVPCQW